MKVEDLQPGTEDITPLEKEIIEGSKEELTPEQQEMQNKFFRSAIVKRYKAALANLYNVMRRRLYTISNVKNCILDKDKTLPFTASQRQFIMSFKDEFLVDCLKDIYKEKDLHAINLTISESIQTGAGNSGDVQGDS